MVVRLSALRTSRFLTPGNTPGTHFCYKLSRPQGHSAIGTIMSMKNTNDTIWNRTSDPPICSTANRNEYQAYFMEVKAAATYGLPPSCAECLEIWAPQPYGTLRACTGIALHLPFTALWTNA